MSAFNERTTSYITCEFKDKDGGLQLPSGVTYRIDCLTSGVAIKPTTAVTPATSVEITCSATDNTIQNQGNALETRRVTVNATYGAGDEVHQQVDYDVINLTFLP